jgi:transposase
MQEITRVGVDLAKNVIQIHAVDAQGKTVINRQLPRGKFKEWCVQLPAGCQVAMEACGGAHYWARALRSHGIAVRLVAPHLVTAYRLQGKSGKNDANDAAAVCEAASRPQMHFVPVKTVEQQSVLGVHRLRESLKDDRVGCINRIRSMLAEFGVVIAQSPEVLRKVLAEHLEDASNEMNGLARTTIQRMYEQWLQLEEHLKWCDERIAAHLKTDARARQAQQLLGVGPISASALLATVGDFKQFASAAQFSAWLGLVPKQNSTGGKSKLGSITKRGDIYLRMLLVQGAKAAVLAHWRHDSPTSQWLERLKERSGWQVAAVALANKNARILWAMFARDKAFDPHHISIRPASG